MKELINSTITPLRKFLPGSNQSGDSRTEKAGKQVIWSFVFQSINILVGLLYVPLLLNYLSQEKYGIWLTLTSIIGWFSFFDIGLGNGMRNKLTEAIAKKEYDLANRYVSTTYALLLIIFGLILTLFFAINPFINWNEALNTYSLTREELAKIATIVFTFFILRFIVQLIGVIYMSHQRPSVNNALTAAASIISLGAIYILMRFSESGDLAVLSAIITAVPVILFIGMSVYAFSSHYSYLRPKLASIDFSLKKDLLSLGLRFFIMQITAVILYSTSSFFISQIYGPDEVVIYNLVFKYFQLPIMAYSIILMPLWSSVTDAYASGDFAWLEKTMRKLNKVSAFFLGGIIVMALFSQSVFNLWVGSQIHIPFLTIATMAIYAAMNVYIAPYSNFINGTGKLKLTTIFSVAGIGIYFVCIYFLARHFTDSTGVIISIIIPYALFAFIQPYQSNKLLKKNAIGIVNE